jgi:NDP-sugar pyrophosphorylase family protein
MKAMVLAAGLGTRMRPLTLLRAKPALPVLNRPLLHWTLERLARAGVSEVMINLHHLPDSVTSVVGDGKEFGLRVSYSRERTILGTAGGPRKVRAFFGDEAFLLVNGDVLFDFDLRRLLTRHRQAGALATLALKPNPDPETYRPVVTGPDGWVRWLPGTRRRRRGTTSLFTGVHVMNPCLLDRLSVGPADSVRDVYAPALAEGGKILGVRVVGPWLDLGRPALYLSAQLREAVRRSRREDRSVIDSEARIGRGVRLERAVVGPGAEVGDGASVVGSVLWGGAHVGAGAQVRRCVVTDEAVVAEGDRLSSRVVLRRGRSPL